MNRPTSGFLALPRELRDEIYHHILNEGVYTFEDDAWYYTYVNPGLYQVEAFLRSGN
jgi:hypothetical protein